jgi:hypothetical protein
MSEHDFSKNVADGLFAGIGIGALVQWLPPIAAGLTILWTALRIYDWIEKRWLKKG